MNGTTATPEFHSQMEFLRAYASSTEQKRNMAAELKKRQDTLKASVEEAERIKAELSDLEKSIRLDEKFLINMNEMVLRGTGAQISEGPLFERRNSEVSNQPTIN